MTKRAEIVYQVIALIGKLCLESNDDAARCGEDCCCCLHPEENVICDICRGAGGWYRCMSSVEWCQANPLDGRESVERGTFEWFKDNYETLEGTSNHDLHPHDGS